MDDPVLYSGAGEVQYLPGLDLLVGIEIMLGFIFVTHGQIQRSGWSPATKRLSPMLLYRLYITQGLEKQHVIVNFFVFVTHLPSN
jgi:hypothetical protein